MLVRCPRVCADLRGAIKNLTGRPWDEYEARGMKSYERGLALIRESIHCSSPRPIGLGGISFSARWMFR